MSNATCSVAGCAAPVHVLKRGLCKKHYHQWWHAGKPESGFQQRPFPLVGRKCAMCGDNLPAGSMRTRLYCSRPCKDRAKSEVSCCECGGPAWKGGGSRPDGQIRCRKCIGRVPPGGSIRHGTTNSYIRHGCRCGKCRAAMAKRQREYAARYKARTGVDPRRRYDPPPKPQMPCSDCGAPLLRNRSSEPRCGACRRAHRNATRRRETRRRQAERRLAAAAQGSQGGTWVSGSCSECGEWFVRRGAVSSTCSRKCGQRRIRREYRRQNPGKSKWKFVSPTTRQAIYDRDQWICQLCLDPVDPELRETDPWGDWAPSLDHIVPRSQGGSHDPENLRLAHRWCNSVRGDETWHSEDVLRVG